MFALITTFYYEKDVTRRNEFLQAIRYNVDNSNIVKIYILCESGEECINGLDSKIEIIKQVHRPKFKDLIIVANQLSSNVIKIIANTDIYFDETLAKAKKIKNSHLYCLTRWDLKTNGEIEFYPNFKSQDSWIFRDILPENIGGYFMGIPGCDNRLASEFKVHGFKISNPSLSIISIHVHNSLKRNYQKNADRVIGQYDYVLPSTLNEPFQSGNIRYIFLLMKRKFYLALTKNNLEGKHVKLSERFSSYFLLLYYRIMLKTSRFI